MAAFFYGLSIALKPWPAFLYLLIISKVKNKMIFTLNTFMIPLLSISLYSLILKLPLIKTASSILYSILTYRSLFSHWGSGQILKNLFFPIADQPPIFFQKIFLRLFLFVFFIHSLKLSKEEDLLKSITKLFLFFYTFTVGFSIQYLSWIVPFLVLSKSKKILPITFFSTFYLLSNYLSWKSSFNFLSRWISPLGITLWAIFLISWYSEEKSFSKTPNS